MNNIKIRMIFYFVFSLTVGATAWIISQPFLNNVSINETIELAKTPVMYIFVVTYFLFFSYILKRQLDRIGSYMESPIPQDLPSVQRTISNLPLLYIVGSFGFALLGSASPMLGKDFLSIGEFIIGLVIAAILVLVVCMPFLTSFIIDLEKWTSGIPLPPKRAYLTLAFKISLNYAVNICFILCLFFITIYNVGIVYN